MVSACKCWMLVSSVHPVAILRAVFWVVWSLFLLVSFMIGDQTVLPYSNMGWTVALYVAINVSFCFPHEVPERALTILLALSAFSLVILTCLPKFNFGSKVSPRILGFLTVGIMVLFMVKFKIVSYSAGLLVTFIKKIFMIFLSLQ